MIFCGSIFNSSDDTKNELLCLVLVELGVEYLEDAPSSLHYTIDIAALTS